MRTKTLYTDYPEIQIRLTTPDAKIGSHPGDCENDVKILMQKPYIKKQLDKLPVEQLKRHLGDYGAWDDEQLKDHEENKMRFLWIACGDVLDGNC